MMFKAIYAKEKIEQLLFSNPLKIYTLQVLWHTFYGELLPEVFNAVLSWPGL